MNVSQIYKLIRFARLAREQSGKSFMRQLIEIAQLRLGNKRLGPSEYYEFEIFDDRIFSPESKGQCVGWRASAALDLVRNHDYWRATANDKLLNYALLQHYGFPIPETVATYSPRGRTVGKELALDSQAQLEQYLTDAMPFPIFIKPISGTYGHGTFLLVGYEAASKKFIDVYGKKLPLSDLMSVCLTPQHSGMLFQRCLAPHDDVRRMTGNSTSCVRVIVVLGSHEPKVHMTFWKIARAHNITDNFHMGSTGNLLAAICKETGQIERVISGLWPDGLSLTHHPDTLQELVGKFLPDWQNAMDMCLKAANCFPGLTLQHWDVAFCSGQPVLMELNTEADLAIPQYLSSVPFFDEAIGAKL